MRNDFASMKDMIELNGFASMKNMIAKIKYDGDDVIPGNFHIHSTTIILFL